MFLQFTSADLGDTLNSMPVRGGREVASIAGEDRRLAAEIKRAGGVHRVPPIWNLESSI